MIDRRFMGTVQRLGPVNTRVVLDWLKAIPYEQWPQQHPIHGQMRPAMINVRSWYQFGVITDPLAERILSTMTDGAVELNRLLSVVMPGHGIEPHVDKHTANWWGRIHVPMTDAPLSRFIVGGEAHHLEPGWAYLVNIAVEHSVENPDPSPRVHFMLDVGAPN